MKFSKNIILNTDSYKVSMWKQYPPGTTGIYSYIESRGGRYDETVFFGLQGFIKEYLCHQVTKEDVDEATIFFGVHGEPFNRDGWMYIVEKLDGWLPLRIRAVPEGTIVPVSNVLATIENTDPACFWLTTWVETPLLRAIWYPTTVATQSKRIKNIIADYLNKTGTPESINFKLHDFGARGVSSLESAAIGGAAHLVNFQGSDTVSGILYANEMYKHPMSGFSIPAAEHSTITSWGREFERDAYRNMIKQFGKKGAIFAVVSDSYNVFNAAENIWGTDLKQEIIDSGATVVIRPDSGDPVVVCSKIIRVLGEKFGWTINEKGYKVLNNVRIIQGDGVNENSISQILGNFLVHGWSADNIAFGMGGALLQQLDRDTQRFAMKCSAAKINDKWVPVQKDPITDTGKRSKAGRVTLYKNGDKFTSGVEDWPTDALETVYENGKLLKEYTFQQIRDNSNL